MKSQLVNSTQREQEVGQQDRFIEIHWVARKLGPTILIGALLIFATLMAVSLFVFHSTGAFKSLALAAAASVVALLPQVLSKIEYQANETGLRTRPHGKANNEEFKQILLWSELDHVEPVTRGFRYCKKFDEKSCIRRFVKKQFSDKYSGEIRVETEDQDLVHKLLVERGVTLYRH